MHASALRRPFSLFTLALAFCFMAVFLLAAAWVGKIGSTWDSRLLSWVQFVLYMGVPSLLVLVIYGQSPESVGTFSRRHPYTHYVWTLVLALMTLSSVAFLTQLTETIAAGGRFAAWAQTWNDSRSQALEALLSDRSPQALMLVLFTMALSPAVLEEFFFRGIVLQSLLNSRMGTSLSIVIQALLFSVVHLSPYEFLGIFLSGILLGYLRTETQSLLLPMLFHFLFNGITLIAQFQWPDPESLEQSLSHPIIALIATAMGTLALYRLSNFSQAHE